MSEAKSGSAHGLRAALFLAAASLLPACSNEASAQVPAEAWLETSPATGKVSVTALARGGPLASARYELKSEKAAGGSRSTTRQSGSLKLACCEPVTLSHLSLGIRPGERYTITLRLFDGEALLVEKILLYPNDAALPAGVPAGCSRIAGPENQIPDGLIETGGIHVDRKLPVRRRQVRNQRNAYRGRTAAMNITTLVLVRHGETAWNVEGRIQGHLDVPLNETGLAQAAAVGKRFRSERFDAIYSSDLIRAFRTASPVVANPEVDIIRDPRLRERHLGVLQGLAGDEGMKTQPAAWKAFKSREADLPLEGGESLGAFSNRVIGFVESMLDRHAGGRLLVVTHGGALDAAYRHASGMPLAAIRDFPIYNASVNVISHDGRRWTIESWGDISHLPQELAMDDS